MIKDPKGKTKFQSPFVPFKSLSLARMTGQAEFTESELEAVTMVFKQYETGVREACINVKDLLPALVSLGLNMVNLNSTEAGGKYFDFFYNEY